MVVCLKKDYWKLMYLARYFSVCWNSEQCLTGKLLTSDTNWGYHEWCRFPPVMIGQWQSLSLCSALKIQQNSGCACIYHGIVTFYLHPYLTVFIFAMYLICNSLLDLTLYGAILFITVTSRGKIRTKIFPYR